MSTDFKYVIVDDDPFNNMICSMVIKDALGEEAEIKAFTKPEEALVYFKENISGPTILFLDINMPTMTGWEFLQRYEAFSDEVKIHVTIFILSSSLDRRDKDKATTNKYVQGFISKPLDFETILSIAGGEFKINE